METVFFYNTPLLPLECIKTFGVSAKENESPIGYFGTGLKYAIAVLLREKCGITLQLGGVFYTFRTEVAEIRGKEFELIYMNDDLLPFTTELGKNWKLWQAYRELYSNCIDENGTIGTDEVHGPGTCFMVSGLLEIHESRSDFILLSQPKHVLENLEIHESDKPGIFYRGIRVLDLPTKYSYNILSSLSLTEDRTAHQWEVNYELTKALVKSSNLDAVSDVISITDESFYEAKLDWTKSITPSEGFMQLVNGMKVRSHTLGGYYGAHYPTFVGKLDRCVLSKASRDTLAELRRLLPFKPKSLLLAAMQGDYQLNGEEVVLNAELLANKDRLRLAYAVACYRLQHKDENPFSSPSDYEIIARHMLHHLNFVPQAKKQPKVKAAGKVVAHA